MHALPKPRLALFDIDETLLEYHHCRIGLFQIMSEIGIEDCTELNDSFLVEDGKYKALSPSDDELINFHNYPKIKVFLDKNGITEEQLDAIHKKHGVERDKKLPISDELVEAISHKLDGYVEILGASAFLKKLRNDGVSIGFITTAKSDFALASLKMRGLYQEGDFFRGREDLVKDFELLAIDRAKGDLAIPSLEYSKKAGSINIATKEHGLENQRDSVWYIGDAWTDMASATEAGVIAISFGKRGKDNRQQLEFYISNQKQNHFDQDFSYLSKHEMLEVPGYKALDAIYSKCQSSEKHL